MGQKLTGMLTILTVTEEKQDEKSINANKQYYRFTIAFGHHELERKMMSQILFTIGAFLFLLVFF